MMKHDMMKTNMAKSNVIKHGREISSRRETGAHGHIHDPTHDFSRGHAERNRSGVVKPGEEESDKVDVMGSISRIKARMRKASALVDYYNDLTGKRISDEEQLKQAKSRIVFTQKEILRLCLESKKTVKDIEGHRRAFHTKQAVRNR